MPQWKPIVGLSFDATSFDVYCKSLTWPTWRPNFIVVHNTAVPNLAQRPNGFTRQHIQNLVGYYRDQQKWSAGPHLFVDDKQIWVFTPLTTTGRHSPAWNAISLGVEMLGDYQQDDFDAGRGAAVQRNAVCAVASLCGALGLEPGKTTIRLHKEDPVTTHKTCPGKNVSKDKFIAAVIETMHKHYGADHDPQDPHPE
jgi:N-acetylmuramoyl-L-alanine amidase CwlA